MIADYFIQLGIIFAWHAFGFRSNILLYLTNWHINVRFATNAKYFFAASASLFFLGSILTSFELNMRFIIPTSLYFFTLLAFSYGTTRGTFEDLETIRPRYEGFVQQEPEMIVVQLNFHPNATAKTGTHVIPMKLLRARDLILPITNKDLGIDDHIVPTASMRYSLTYCLLCNTAHAFLLPIIQDKEIEISSRGASTVNGNKILADGRGKYVWQQLTGQGISGKAKPYPLVELEIIRFLWSQVPKQFPQACYYDGSIQPIQYRVYRGIGALVRKVQFIRMEVSKVDPRLGKKVPVAGVNLLDVGTKAYQLELFTPGNVSLHEDTIGGVDFTLVYNGHDVVGFKTTGLACENDTLQQEGKSWSILGQAIGEHDNLEQIPVTGHVYWYMWSKFYPDTELYEQ
jgi:hypothetical protein